MKKKIISLLVTAVMLLSCLPIAAGAETSGTCGDNIAWVLDDNGTLTISGIGDMPDYDWSAVAPWNSQKEAITKIDIGNGITSIGDLAFAGCVNLVDISIPDTVQSIGNWAFDSCGSLSGLNLPYGIYSIGKMAFWSCSSLMGELEIPDSVVSIEPYAFMNCENLTKVILPENLKVLSDGVFENCTSLSDVEIPDGLTSIGSSFAGCSALTQIPSLPDSVTAIGNSAFAYCTGITKLSLSENIKTIGESAFRGCTGLTEIIIPDTVTGIDSEAFAQCSNVIKAYIPSSVTNFGDRVFSSCSSLTEVALPDNMNTIPYMMFYYCDALEEVEIPGSVTSIGEYAFSNCTSLKNIILPSGIATIPNYLFYACASLESIAIPEGVTSIGSCAFYSCSSLTDIRIPDSVTAINNSAFYGCNTLGSVYYGGDAEKWDKITISGGNTPLTNADVRYNYGKIGGGTIGDNITWLIDDKGTLTVSGTGNIPDYEDVCYTPWYAYKEKITKIVIEKGITGIGNFAFANCTAATTAEISDTVTRIGEYAFNRCIAITELTIPDSVTTIGWFAFAYCSNLEKIILSENLTVIDRATFAGCTKLSDIVIPDSVTTIKQRAFMECSSLKSIILSSNVTTLENYLFEACDALKGVFYRGNENQWADLVTNSIQSVPANVPMYYNYTGGNVIDCGTLGDTVTWLVDESGNLIIGGSGIITSEPWSSYKKDVINIVIGDGITDIGAYRFQAYSNVKTITFGKNIKSFSGNSVSFAEMYDLHTVYWNATATEDLLFGGEYSTSFMNNSGRNCGGTNIIFGENVEVVPDCFARATVNKMIIPAGVKTIGIKNISAKEIHIADLAAWCNINFSTNSNPLFYNAKLYIDGEEVTDLVIPDKVTKISDYAFYNLKNIQSVTIPDSVTEIGDYAFYYCNGVTELKMGSGVETIGNYAFYGCSGITELNLGTAVTDVGNSAFESCSNLVSIRFSENMSSIGASAFSRCYSVRKIYYGGGIYDWENIDGIRNVPDATVYYYYTDLIKGYGECGDNVKWVLTDSDVLTISGTGDIVDFDGRYNAWLDAKELVIEEGITNIPDKLFYDHRNLSKVTIADSVTEIGYQAFSFCENISELTLGSGVEELGESAFEYCTSLTELTIPGSVKSMTHNAFSYCDNLKTVVIEEGVPYIYNDTFVYCTSLEEITIPLSVKSVGTAAFGYCTALTKVNYAGTKADWNNIVIEEGNKSLVTAYENSLIYDGDGSCGEDIEWNLENGVLTISGTGDMYDYDISDVALPWYELGDSVKSLIIEEGVTSIGDYTFWLCFNLTEVTIPHSVKEIGTYAFGNCDKLTDVYYIGSQADWNKISFASLNPYIKDCKIHYLEYELNLELEENEILVYSDKKVDKATVLVALYDDNYEVLDIKYIEADIVDGVTVIPSPVTDYSGAVITKIMGWNGLSGLVPIFKATEIQN